MNLSILCQRGSIRMKKAEYLSIMMNGIQLSVELVIKMNHETAQKKGA